MADSRGPGRVWVVGPAGNLEDDPNLTHERCPGNPTTSHRARQTLRVVGEVVNWVGHSPDQVLATLEHPWSMTDRSEAERAHLTAHRPNCNS